MESLSLRLVLRSGLSLETSSGALEVLRVLDYVEATIEERGKYYGSLRKPSVSLLWEIDRSNMKVAAKAFAPKFEQFDYSPTLLDAKSTASTANGRTSLNPEDEQDTDESVEAGVVRGSVFRPSERSQRGRISLHKKSFKQELEKLGSKANQILDKNPTKLTTSRGPSPEPEREDRMLLPFQRRARSNSPIREELNLTKKASVNLFSYQGGPVKANKPVGKKTAVVDAFTGVSGEEERESLQNEDEELEILKLEYARLLDQTASGNKEEVKAEEGNKCGKVRKSKITFM